MFIRRFIFSSLICARSWLAKYFRLFDKNNRVFIHETKVRIMQEGHEYISHRFDVAE